MELAQRYLMSMKRRELLMRPTQSSYSWEEKAFADDTSGVLGGVVWPPRSYTCSFCNREFRSAQALGGHMNVHRRDRARLKQSLITTTTTTSAAAAEPTLGEVQVLHHQNPNFSSPLQPPIQYRVSSAMCSSKENRTDGNSIPNCTSRYSFLAQKGNSFDPLTRKEEPVCLNHGPHDTNLSMGLHNSVTGARAYGDGEMSFKRPKTSISSPLSLLLNPCSSDLSCSLQSSNGLKVGNYTEDLDLELRLGIPPKVK